jgi:hypothetical protein
MLGCDRALVNSLSMIEIVCVFIFYVVAVRVRWSGLEVKCHGMRRFFLRNLGADGWVFGEFDLINRLNAMLAGQLSILLLKKRSAQSVKPFSLLICSVNMRSPQWSKRGLKSYNDYVPRNCTMKTKYDKLSSDRGSTQTTPTQGIETIEFAGAPTRQRGSTQTTPTQGIET